MATEYTLAFKFWLIFSFAFLLVDNFFFCSYYNSSYDPDRDWNCPKLLHSEITYLLFLFLAQRSFLLGIVEILFCFGLMAESFVRREKKYSTCYMIFDVLYQNSLINFSFFLLYITIFYVYLGSFIRGHLPFGWHSLMILYYWRDAKQNPQDQSVFFSLKKKYFKWLLFIFTLVITFDLFTVFAVPIATIQYYLRNKCACECFNEAISKFESLFCCSFLTKKDDFITMNKRSCQEEKSLELEEKTQIQSENVFEKGMGVMINPGKEETNLEINWK